jgi:hypothetical protein
MANDNGRTRITVRLTDRLAECLDAVLEVGIHGGTTAEIARKFIENEVERLIREGLIKVPQELGVIGREADKDGRGRPRGSRPQR